MKLQIANTQLHNLPLWRSDENSLLQATTYVGLRDTEGLDRLQMNLVYMVTQNYDGGFPGSSDSKESACNVEDPGSIPELGRSPKGGHGNPTPIFLPGEFQGQRSLVGHSPWGLKESDMIEGLTLSLPKL